MGWPPGFHRIVALPTPFLSAIPAKDGRIQIQGMAQGDGAHPSQDETHQRLADLGDMPIGERLEQPLHGIRRGKAGQPQQAGQEGVAAIAGQVLKPLDAQRETIEPGQQDLLGRNLIGRAFGEGEQDWPQGCA
jgi:hypothetical protein